MGVGLRRDLWTSLTHDPWDSKHGDPSMHKPCTLNSMCGYVRHPYTQGIHLGPKFGNCHWKTCLFVLCAEIYDSNQFPFHQGEARVWIGAHYCLGLKALNLGCMFQGSKIGVEFRLKVGYRVKTSGYRAWELGLRCSGHFPFHSTFSFPLGSPGNIPVITFPFCHSYIPLEAHR